MAGQKFRFENPWKLAFFILIGIIIGTAIFLYIRITAEREKSSVLETPAVVTGEPSFQVQITKDQANQLINFYLNDFQAKSPVKYRFVLENQALLNGTFHFLGHDLNFYLYFEPYVLDNGDVQLKAKSISIGRLSLPISELMSYVKNNFKLPSWVETDTKNEQMIIHLSQYKLANGMYVQAEKIDLLDDNIKFNVFLPIPSEDE